MFDLNRKWQVYLFCHSHTDIGYTAAPECITREQIFNIREVMRIIEEGRHPDFKWVCETLWAVEKFLETASEDEKQRFFGMVKAGKISVSGSYLNMTEAICEKALVSVIKRGLSPFTEKGVSPTCAMTSDVNGYSWGFVDILNECGIKYLISQPNSTHGHEPFLKRQKPFVWRGAKGGKLTVWLGEHYNMGNWAGLEPIFGESDSQSLERAEKLLPEYLKKLEEDGYAYDFCPLSVSGVFTDNAPPNEKVEELVRAFNEKHGNEIEIKISTLEEFFERAETLPLEEYSGDWTDFWADGIGSTPFATALFKNAQREYQKCRLLDENADLSESEYYLNLFAEHTWGYHASVLRPYDKASVSLDLKKQSLSAKADEVTANALDKIEMKQGKLRKSFGGFDTLRVINQNKTDGSFVVESEIVYPRILKKVNRAICKGESLPAVIKDGRAVFECFLKAGESKTYKLVYDEDFEEKTVGKFENGILSNGRFSVTFDEKGISSVFDKKQNRELINGTAFLPIYDKTPLYPDCTEYSSRSKMALHRRVKETVTVKGNLCKVSLLENNGVFCTTRTEYSLDGFSFFYIDVTLFSDKIEVTARFNKSSETLPENLFLTLPFVREKNGFFIDKTGCVIRPGVDMLPFSCYAFYLTQNGAVFKDGDCCTAVGLPDAPLVFYGDGEKTDFDKNCSNEEDVRSWVMNNFWETNFKLSLGGIYEFRYFVLPTKEMPFENLLSQSLGVTAFYKE